MPLTGVTTPFLSYGRSSMIANFFSCGVLLAVSHRSAGETEKEAFSRPIWWLGAALAAGLVVVVGRITFLQTWAADRTVAATALALQADGVRRFEYNPRLVAAAQQIVRGTITDRNGIPLATSRAADLQAHAAVLTELGVSPTDVCPPARVALLSVRRPDLPHPRRLAEPGELGGREHVVRRARLETRGCAATTITHASSRSPIPRPGGRRR